MTFQEGVAAGLHRAFYISEARIADPCGAGPQAILQVAGARNAALDVTGLLLYAGAHFAQVLEGSAPALLRFTPILTLTTESQQAKRDEAKRLGATGWLVKPVGNADLVKVIRQVLPGA